MPLITSLLSFVLSLSHVRLFVTPWTAACQPSLSFTRACSNSCPLSQWCSPTISSSVIPFSSCPQSFPKSGSFPMSWSQHQPSLLHKWSETKLSRYLILCIYYLILYLPSVVVQRRVLESDPAPLIRSPHPWAKLSWKLFSHAWLFATPWNVAHQDPLSMK